MALSLCGNATLILPGGMVPSPRRSDGPGTRGALDALITGEEWSAGRFGETCGGSEEGGEGGCCGTWGRTSGVVCRSRSACEAGGGDVPRPCVTERRPWDSTLFASRPRNAFASSGASIAMRRKSESANDLERDDKGEGDGEMGCRELASSTFEKRFKSVGCCPIVENWKPARVLVAAPSMPLGQGR